MKNYGFMPGFADCRDFFKNFKRLFFVGRRVIWYTCEQARLGEVRSYDMRVFAETVHACAHFGCIGLIYFAVVSHHGINHDYGIHIGEISYCRRYGVDLCGIAQKSAVYRVETQVKRLPVRHYFFHFVRQVKEGEALEPAGVR